MFFILSNNKILSYDINSPGANPIELLKKIIEVGEIPIGARIQIDGKLQQGMEWFYELKVKFPDIYSEQKSHITVDWFLPVKGGFFMEVIDAVIGLVKFLVIIPKIIIWIGRLFVWAIKTLAYLLVLLAQVIDKEGVKGLVKFVSQEIITAPFMILAGFARKLVNGLGNQTINGWLAGADNAPDENSPDKQDTLPSDDCTGGKRKCYRTPDGSVPPSVIVATVLFPPAGVFMEYGLHGWIQIIICIILSFMFYFPGLIYALILLYC
jgi:uncharacterized membrane protein YqaE (UPF0057 family)